MSFYILWFLRKYFTKLFDALLLFENLNYNVYLNLLDYSKKFFDNFSNFLNTKPFSSSFVIANVIILN